MTRYVFAYDLESDICVTAARTIAEIHRRWKVPATFFILGKTIESHEQDLREIFEGDELFDIESHTYSHRLFKDSKMHGPGIDKRGVRKEVTLGRKLVENVFGSKCLGLRTGCGFYRGLQGEKEKLSVIWDSGIRFISTDLRGPDDSIPSGLQQAYSYDAEGFPDLIELPGHGWHDNVLKREKPMLCLTWPRVLDWGIPAHPPRTPEEEVSIQKIWMEKAISKNLDCLSLVYHPHSIYRMDSDCRTVDLLIRAVRAVGMETSTYCDLYDYYSHDPEALPGREFWNWEED